MAMILAVGLPELPEIRPGDDLAALIASAWRDLAATHPELAPRAGDILVVTQKIVSKAEGRIVDLRTIEPRPEAVEFARDWDRDARQVEVVLRESAEILRMERGLIISRTQHGFVCANAGVDASNTGQASFVTLLPVDPDKSARRPARGSARPAGHRDRRGAGDHRSATRSAGRGASASSTWRLAWPA